MSWDTDGWSREKKAAGEGGRPGAPPERPEGVDETAWREAGRVAAKKKRRKLILIGGASLLALVVLLVALAPTIASGFAPGIVEGAANDAVAGRVEVDSASLTWFGSQRLRGVQLFDPASGRVARVEVEVERGLFGLLFGGGLDLGTVYLRGEADVVRDAEGVTNVERALGVGAAAPPGSGGGPAGEPSAPSGLRAEVELADFTVTYEDPALVGLTDGSVRVVRIADLRGLARVGPGSPTEVRLAGKVTTGRSRDAVDTPAGSIDLSAVATGLIARDGAINTTDATIDASVEVDQVATALIDALAQQEGRLVAALGADSSAQVEVDGTLREATVALNARSGTVEAAANLVYDGAAQRVRSGGPITVSGDTARLIGLAAGAEAALKSSAGLDITRWPRATLSVGTLQFALPRDGRLDLRGSGAVVTIALGELAGTVPVPAVPTAAGNHDAQDRWRVALEPAELEIAARDLAGEITVRTETGVSVDRDPAGRLAVNLSVADLLDASGRPRTDRAPRVRGSVSATGVALGIVEPLLQGTGLRLTQDIGPTLDIALRAEPRTDGSQGVTLVATADKLRAEGTLVADDRTVTLADQGLTVRLTETGPLVRRLSGPADINIDSGGDVTLAVTRFQAPYAALVGGDLSTLAIDAGVELSETVGRARTLASDRFVAGERRRVALRGMRLGVRSDGLGSGARVSVDGTARVDNRPAGMLDGDLFVAGFITPEGAIVAGVPSAMSGEIALRGVSADVLQPLVTDAGIDLAGDVGETIDLRINASSLASAGAADAPTRVTLTLDASRLDATGEFEIAGTTLRTFGSGVRVEHASPMATGARLLGLLEGPEALRVENGGRLVATLTDLSLPIDAATRGIDADLARGSFRAELANARVLRTAEGPGAGADLSIGSFVVDGSLTPGQGVRATIAGSMTGAGQAFRIEGDASAPSIAGDLAQTTSVSVLLERMPTALASLLPLPQEATTVGTVPLSVLLQDVVGPWASVRLGSSPAGAGARAAVVQVVSDGAELTLNATGDGLFEAGTRASISALDGRGTIRLRPAGLARTLAAVGIEGENGAPPPITLDRTAEIGLIAGLNTRGDGVDLRVRADRVGLNGLQQALGLAGDPGTVGVGFEAGASVPTLALLGPGDTSHTLTATLRGDARDDRGSRVASVDLEGSASTMGLTPDGPARVRGSIAGVRSAWLDRLLTEPGQDTPSSPLVAGALGPDVSVDFEMDATLAQGGLQRATATLTPRSETIATQRPIRLALANDTITLPEPVELTWQMPQAWATAHLGGTLTTAGDRPGAPSTSRPIVSFMNPVTWTVRADTLRYPLDRTRAGAASPDIALSIVGTAMRVTLVDGSERVYPRSTITARTIDADATVALTAEVDAGGGNGGRALSFNGRVFGLDPAAAARGVEPAITGQGEARELPSGLLDALAGSGGGITRLAGNTMRATVELQDFPRLGGTVNLRSDFPNGSARYEGTVTNPTGVEKLLVLRSPAEIRLDRIEEQSSSAVTTFLPAFGRVSKDPARHAPARLAVRRLALPFSGEITAIEAEATVDPGEVGFQIAGGLGQLLSLTGQATEGTALQRFESVTVRMNNGIATYENFKLPIGEFRFESSGRFDLVANTEQITLWAPLAALATEGLSIPGLGGNRLINPDALVPINRTGPMAGDNPWRLDLAGARGQLIRPADLIRDAIEGSRP